MQVLPQVISPRPAYRHHQRYCAAACCRAASKAASQARWLAAAESRDYFRGPVHVARVKAWRSRHPGYWRKQRRRVALQDLSLAQPLESANRRANFARPALQEIILAQPAVLIGLIAHIAGTPLQEEIARTTGRLLRLGRKTFSLPPGRAITKLTAGHARDRLRDILQ